MGSDCDRIFGARSSGVYQRYDLKSSQSTLPFAAEQPQIPRAPTCRSLGAATGAATYVPLQLLTLARSAVKWGQKLTCPRGSCRSICSAEPVTDACFSQDVFWTLGIGFDLLP